MKRKYVIAKVIANNFYHGDEPSYEHLLSVIYENYYRTIGKVPINMFILGIIQHFVVKDVEHANRILESLKEVVTEALESCGVELTYTDNTWLELKIIENTSRWGDKYMLDYREKGYMAEFFEI